MQGRTNAKQSQISSAETKLSLLALTQGRAEMKFLCEKRHLWSRLPGCDQCFTTCEKRRKKNSHTGVFSVKMHQCDKP